MQNTATQPRSTEKFSKTMGGTIKSLVGGKGRTYFVLEHKTNSQKFRIGQSREFIGDYIELGRGNNFAVSFGDDCAMVSRPHAAIIRDGESWIIRQLSKTNPTLLNGVSIKGDQKIKNGDEIQLAGDGPKVSFLSPANNLVGSMGMTNRMKAVANEAFRPYKSTIISLIMILILSVSGLGYYISRQNEHIDNLIADQTAISKNMADSVKAANVRNSELQTQMQKMSKEVSSLKKLKANNFSATTTNNITAPSTLQEMYSNVYIIVSNKLSYVIKGETKEIEFGGVGTGFLLNDGRFVTARHVIEPWNYLQNSARGEESSKVLFWLNVIANNGGKVIHSFTAFSPDGSKISFTNEDFSTDNSAENSTRYTDDDGNSYMVSDASINDGSDWAACKTNTKGVLSFDSPSSSSLNAGTKLYVLGYPFAKGANSKFDIKPIYSECQVSRDGLDNGIIDISNRGFDSGNSGGPVFILKDNKYYVIGIVSAEQGNQGVVVPISSTNKSNN